MKMVKSLLLGSAAGVVAVAGAQAADLPVKAKAVEYVKICSLYGAGFYYIPGTDICMKIGGYVRFQENWSNGGKDQSNGPWIAGGGRDNRLDSSDYSMRARAIATFDTRQQTQYGVLRTYLMLGHSGDNTNTEASYAKRAFIQIAGFTFGKATSYMDFFPAAALLYQAGPVFNGSDTGDSGQLLAAYTAQFGGGVSATIAVELSQRAPTVFTQTGALGTTAGPQNNYGLGAAPTMNVLGGGTTVATGNPDIVGALRWDGTWGAFQLAGVLHDASGGYYGTVEALGHPGNKWGWAISPGLRINTPMIGPGDYLIAVYNYSQGAVKFGSKGTQQTGMLIWRGASLGYGNFEDGVYGGSLANGQSVELTTAWNVAVGYEHFWTPALQTSIVGSYSKITHNANAASLICNGNSTSTTLIMGTVAGGCNPDFSAWNIGSRTQWNVVRGFYVGVDVIYEKLNTALPNSSGTLLTTAVNGAKGIQNVQPYTVDNQSAWSFSFRAHRDIVP